jgi:ABC-2 type transport system ATP-binding protein
MSLKVKDLTKVYGSQQAVKGISFEIPQGQIVGFLGPNGAGKSTTMKILSGFIPPGSGQAWVCGIEVNTDAIAARKKIGYLPEHNPLYLDMYVAEFLAFSGSLYGLKGQTLGKRVEEMISLCGLSPERHKRIEALSKGYRQRVGIAQALIHNPEVLILDEPTSGLDPNQLIEIRKLVKGVSKEKTVLFSTHIMQEVQALCDRVILIDQGSIVADAPLDEILHAGLQSASLIAEFDHAVDVNLFSSLTGVIEVQEMAAAKYRIFFEQDKDIRPDLFRLAADKNLTLLGLRLEAQSLENVFASLTGKGREL